MKAKLDENLGRSCAAMLAASGHDISTVPEQGMSSWADEQVLGACHREGRTLITLDLDFSNPLRFPPDGTPGIVVLRLPSPVTLGQLKAAIEALLRKFLEAKDRGDATVTLWGDGSPTREFLYVEDAAEGIIAAAERYEGADPVNLGSGEEISMKTLAETVRTLTGFPGEIVWDTAQPNGQPRRKLDTSRALERFGWKATTPLAEGLRKTLDWYLASRKRQKLESREGDQTR